MLAYYVVSLTVLAFLRLYMIMPRVVQSKASTVLPGTCSLAVFLGSGMEFPKIIPPKRRTICFLGGHTSEILKLLSDVDFSRYTPRTYIISEGDNLSTQKAIALELSKVGEDTSHVCVFLCG
jgi:beta-1,4-N-acetylglucosaminyltransferase